MITIKRAVNSFALASLPSLSDPWLVIHVLSMPVLSSGPKPRLCLLSFSLTHAVYTLCGCRAMVLQQAVPYRSLATELTLQLCRGLHKGLSSVALNPPDTATLQYSSPCCGDPQP